MDVIDWSVAVSFEVELLLYLIVSFLHLLGLLGVNGREESNVVGVGACNSHEERLGSSWTW